MYASKRTAAVNRENWLAELAEAIDEAAQLAWRLGYVEGDSADARQLFTRLGNLRGELETIRGNGWMSVSAKISPFWSNLLPPD